MTRPTRCRWSRLLLLLSACGGESTMAVPAAREGSMTDGAACSDVECRALAGVCQEARCDGPIGVCRVGAANEGAPCLEGNPCGASECRAGECVPLAPPPCAELSDACRSGVCHPELGCVAEPRFIPGAHADNAVPLSSTGAGRVTASNACQQPLSHPVACAAELTGPSAFFELDLSEATELTRVHLIVDASFSFEAALTRGPSVDPVVLSCAEPFYFDGQSRRISAELEPGRYQLVVTGSSDTDRGLISVASLVGELDRAAPPNDDCATPLALDGAIEPLSLIQNLAGATPQVNVRCAGLGSFDVFYELDLTGRPSEVLLDVDGGGLEGLYVFASLFAMGSDACTEIVTCGESWSRRLAPGIYRLALHVRPEDANLAFGVRLRVSDGSCATTTNDRPETALELDPALATQRIQGNTACANDDSSVCEEDRGAPDLFYRLDLRQRTAPQRLEIDGTDRSGVLYYVLVSSGETGAPRPTFCDFRSTEFVLAPRLYYLVIDGQAQDAGRFDLELRLRDAYGEPPDCRQDGGTFRYCLSDSEPACTVSSAHPDCIRTATECGLPSDALATFCTAYPGCCDGSAPVGTCEGPWAEVSVCEL